MPSELIDTWKPRQTNVIASIEDYEVVSNAVKSIQGYNITGSGTFNVNLHLPVETYLEKTKQTASFTISALSGGLLSFSLGRYILSTSKTYMRITESEFQLWYDYFGSGNVLAYSEPLTLTGISTSVGSNLVLSIEEETTQITFQVTDGIATIIKTIPKTGGASNELMNAQWGAPFIGTTNGSVFLKNISFSSIYDPMYSKAGIWGDSFVDGSSMINSGLQNRYCALLAEYVGVENVATFGKGGEAIYDKWFGNFIIENEWFRPKYVIIALGTNNTDFEVYRQYILATVNHLKERNQIPVLVTITPRPTNAAFIALANPFIRNLGERFVDMNLAVTVAGDENTWVTGYVFGDNTHPNTAGHLAMFEQIKIDVPELLDNDN